MTDFPPPGPELDALVAGRVMGWAMRESDEFWTDRSGELHQVRYTGPKFCQEPPFDGPVGDKAVLCAVPFRPSTRIEHAWEVLAVIRGWSASRRYEFERALALRTSLRDWPAALLDLGPLDICLAALAAAPAHQPEGQQAGGRQ